MPRQQAVVGDRGKVYPPFKGDPLPPVLVSKALSLADDARIEDPTIRNQIQPRGPVPAVLT